MKNNIGIENFRLPMFEWFSTLIAVISIFHSKHAMLANLIAGFIVVLVGVSLIGPISQQINGSIDCINNNTGIIGYSDYYGDTNSFGGAGAEAEHFGGYDGTLVHKNWIGERLNPECKKIEGWGRTILTIVPLFFALGILIMGIAVTYGGLRHAGMV